MEAAEDMGGCWVLFQGGGVCYWRAAGQCALKLIHPRDCWGVHFPEKRSVCSWAVVGTRVDIAWGWRSFLWVLCGGRVVVLTLNPCIWWGPLPESKNPSSRETRFFFCGIWFASLFMCFWGHRDLPLHAVHSILTTALKLFGMYASMSVKARRAVCGVWQDGSPLGPFETGWGTKV